MCIQTTSSPVGFDSTIYPWDYATMQNYPPAKCLCSYKIQINMPLQLPSTYTHTHTDTHRHTHTHTHTDRHTQTHTLTQTHTHTTQTHTDTHTHTQRHTHTYRHIHTHTIYVCRFVFLFSFFKNVFIYLAVRSLCYGIQELVLIVVACRVIVATCGI